MVDSTLSVCHGDEESLFTHQLPGGVEGQLCTEYTAPTVQWHPADSHFKSTWSELCWQEQTLDEPHEPRLIAGGETSIKQVANMFFKVPQQSVAIKDNKKEDRERAAV